MNINCHRVIGISSQERGHRFRATERGKESADSGSRSEESQDLLPKRCRWKARPRWAQDKYTAELWAWMWKGSCLVSRSYTLLCSLNPNYYRESAEGQSTLWFGGAMVSWKGTGSEGQGYMQPVSKLQSRKLTTLAHFHIDSRQLNDACWCSAVSTGRSMAWKIPVEMASL